MVDRGEAAKEIEDIAAELASMGPRLVDRGE